MSQYHSPVQVLFYVSLPLAFIDQSKPVIKNILQWFVIYCLAKVFQTAFSSV